MKVRNDRPDARYLMPCVAVCILQSAFGILPALPTAAGDVREFEVKRQEVFEFAEKPAVGRDRDKITIHFAAKAYCDATLAIEDGQGKIIRHLASGVLGSNAPAPFQKDSLRQTLTWDGKDDRGEYVRDPGGLTFRVSLGLTARFERTLLWSPRKRTADFARPRRVVASPEGVYVYDSGVGEHLRLFDHEGNYVRTIYPFPAGQIDRVQGLTRRVFQAGAQPAPAKWGATQTTFLTWNSRLSLDSWPCGAGHGVDENYAIGFPVAATAMAIGAGRVALIGERLNRFATDGTSGGMKVFGPGTSVEIVRGGMGWRGGGKKIPAPPYSAALSPDGKWAYLSGYSWDENWDTAGLRRDCLHGVARVELAGDAPATLFAGSLKQHDSGAGDGQFGMAAGIACDAQGRVYVCDFMNDRIQVLDAGGTLVRTIPCTKPASVAIDPRTGGIYVCSWLLKSYLTDKLIDRSGHRPPLVVKAMLTQLGPLDDPRPRASWALPFRQYGETNSRWDGLGGTQFAAAVDFWADKDGLPRVWVMDEGLRAFRIDKDENKLVAVGDFEKDLAAEVAQPRRPYHGRQRLFFDPRRERLYVAEQHHPVPIHSKGVWDLVRIDPASGRGDVVRLPASAEDFAFDADGNIYLRTITEIARFDPETWREVPFDYGLEIARFGYQHGFANVKSSVQLHGESGPSGQIGGMAVSPKGHVAITVINRGLPADRKAEFDVHAIEKYDPRIFPGRLKHWEVHVFDKHGKRVYEDAITGIGYINGIGMDKDDFLYVQASARPAANGDPRVTVNPLADTLLKLPAGKTRIVTSEGVVPLTDLPTRPADVLLNAGTRAWIDGLQWMFPGVGLCGKMRSPHGDCFCRVDSRFALDDFARSFACETQSYDVVVLDSAGNVITRIGRYGNVDDGLPLATAGGPANPRSIGGDEVALMHAAHPAVHTDRRLFIADIGNYRILSVKLDYHATERVTLDVAK